MQGEEIQLYDLILKWLFTNQVLGKNKTRNAYLMFQILLLINDNVSNISEVVFYIVHTVTYRGKVTTMIIHISQPINHVVLVYKHFFHV